MSPEPRAERNIEVDDFGDYVYARFGRARAKFCRVDNTLIIQRHMHRTIQSFPVWEWQDRAKKPCETKEQALQLFSAYLDEVGLFI